MMKRERLRRENTASYQLVALIEQANKQREEINEKKERGKNKEKIEEAKRKNDETLIRKRPEEWI